MQRCWWITVSTVGFCANNLPLMGRARGTSRVETMMDDGWVWACLMLEGKLPLPKITVENARCSPAELIRSECRLETGAAALQSNTSLKNNSKNINKWAGFVLIQSHWERSELECAGSVFGVGVVKGWVLSHTYCILAWPVSLCCSRAHGAPSWRACDQARHSSPPTNFFICCQAAQKVCECLTCVISAWSYKLKNTNRRAVQPALTNFNVKK